jgi:hypothetical protein
MGAGKSLALRLFRQGHLLEVWRAMAQQPAFFFARRELGL